MKRILLGCWLFPVSSGKFQVKLAYRVIDSTFVPEDASRICLFFTEFAISSDSHRGISLQTITKLRTLVEYSKTNVFFRIAHATQEIA